MSRDNDGEGGESDRSADESVGEEDGGSRMGAARRVAARGVRKAMTSDACGLLLAC